MTDKVQKIREEIEKLKSNLIYGACSSQISMETRCKEEAYNEVLAILDTMQEEPMQCMYSKDNYTDEDRKVLCDGCEEECEFNKKEEPVSEPNKELAETYLAVFDKKFPVLPTLKGKQLADYKNFLNKCQQIFSLMEWGIYPIQAKLFKKMSLLWAAWGAEHLQGVGRQDEKEQDIPVSEEFEEAFAREWQGYNDRGAATVDALEDNTQELAFAKGFYRGAKWQEEKDDEEKVLIYKHGFEDCKEQMMGNTIDAQCFGFQGAALFSFRLPADNYLVGSKVKVIVIKED